MGLEGTFPLNQDTLVQGKWDTDGRFPRDLLTLFVFGFVIWDSGEDLLVMHFILCVFVPLSVLLCLCLLTLIVTLGGAGRFGGHRRVKCSVGLVFL